MPRKVKSASRTERFSNNLKHYRLKAGMSQQQLADAVGVGRSYISECELGISRLTFKMAKRYGEVLNVDPNELLGMDAIKYNGNFMATLNSLVYACYDSMIEGVSNGTVSVSDFNQYMVCFNMVSHKLTDDDAIALNSIVKAYTDKVPNKGYLADD